MGTTYTMPLITDETPVYFKHQHQLAYRPLRNSKVEVELFVSDASIGIAEVWSDPAMNNREYMIINNEVVYLDTIKNRNDE